MRIQFLGATQTVTGSKYLVEHNRRKVLIDCGLFQGLKELRLRNREPFPVDPQKIDSVILTHAHLDHTGYLPVLMKQGFRGTVYCTSGTRDLCRILLPDSGRLQEEETEYANRKGFSKHKPALPLYTQEDAERVLGQFRTIPDGPHGAEFDLGGGLNLKLTRAGHIIGSVFVTLSNGEVSILFSGDLGRENDPILRPPEFATECDYLVIESTYGDRLHDPRDPQDQIAEIINRTAARNGVVIVPAFSVGRTQTLLYVLYRLKIGGRIPDIPVYLDSPMSISATGIFRDHPQEHRLNQKQCAGMCNVAQYIHTPEESRALTKRDGPMIIISASGMATGGRILHHLKAFAPDPDNSILFTGYQAAGTRGAAMLANAESVKIHGKYVPVRAGVSAVYNLSAHADQGEILKWLSHFQRPPKTTFITHGEPQAANALREKIMSSLHWNCIIPKYLEGTELL